MRKFLFLLSISAFPVAVQAQEAEHEPCPPAEVTPLTEVCVTPDGALFVPHPRRSADDLGEPVPVSVDDSIVFGDMVRPTITVTANGLATPVASTGQAVTVIDREEIESIQGADATRVLQRTPGVTLSRNGGVGGFTGVNLRGANSEQLLVLVDGVRVADPASPGGGFDFSNLLLGTASKFDILRGSNSTIWGSEAIGGVVDISTRGETGASGNIEYGSRDTLFASAAAGVDGQGFYAGLTGSFYRTDGFSTAASGTEKDGFEQLALGGQVFVDVTDNLEVFAHANWSEGDLDLDGFPPPTFAFSDTLETQETRRHWGDVGFAYYGGDLTLRGAFSLSNTERDNRDAAGTTTFASDGESQRVSLRGEYRAIGPVTVAFGAEKEWTDYSASFSPDGEADIFGAYVQLGFVMGRFAAHVGSRVDDHSLFGSNASYGADVSYGFGDDWRVRASLGEGFKAPTLFQLLSNFGNAALQPEESTSFDLGVEKGTRGRGTHVALTAFRRDSEDLISFVSCFGVASTICTGRPFGTYDNVAQARAQGFEAEAGFDVTGTLRVAGVFTLLDAEDRTTGLELARRPQVSGTLFADWETGLLARPSTTGLKLGADVRFVGESFDNAANTVRLEGYEVVDLRAALPLGETLEVYGRIENLFGADYQTVAGYNTAGRSGFIGVRARM
ncbi:TonB-dependent receptor plug domain-containing protein [Qipengyuania flava]|uniref:TonB-dependent receptor plug domain-containing protein n=1 Tax=Qipengyuania flava TaxID=192812 RepID=UPI001C626D0A|nr:TonB-dependent receptor [Qipengyuania flava]QYJ06417.1 TonB-dependent receptor [Qipengyuania flava]